MIHEKKKFVEAALKRAKSAVSEAEILANAEYWNTAISRLYYACFYAVSAFFECKDIDANTHSSVKSRFHQEFIKTKLLDREFGKHYDKLFDLRLEVDYEFLIFATENTVNPLFERTKSFITEIEKIIASNSDCLDD